MASTTKAAKPVDGEKLLKQIGDQHQMIEKMREEHRKEERRATKKLAELIAQTKDHPDSAVNYSTAAKAMGTVRSYTQGLVKKLEQDKL